jgi:hypothetical protein
MRALSKASKKLFQRDGRGNRFIGLEISSNEVCNGLKLIASG